MAGIMIIEPENLYLPLSRRRLSEQKNLLAATIRYSVAFVAIASRNSGSMPSVLKSYFCSVSIGIS